MLELDQKWDLLGIEKLILKWLNFWHNCSLNFTAGIAYGEYMVSCLPDEWQGT